MSSRYHALRKPHRLVCISLLLLGGCSAFQPSYYENRSRDGENRVVAQGRAASNTAWVHSSNATLGQGAAIAGRVSVDPSHARSTDLLAESGQRLYADMLRSTSSALGNAIDRSIREAFR